MVDLIDDGKLRVRRRLQYLDGQDIGEIEEFNYLGATICKEGGGMKDLKNRLSKMRGTFARFKRIWNSRNITKRT